MKTILATVYAVNPYKGSEDGMGWNAIYQIARFQKVIAITRENNRPHIEQYMQENQDENFKRIQFLYFDLPMWMRFWKKKSRGAMLYFWMWQKAIPSFVKRLNLRFDVVHNLNFHNDWTPSFLYKLKAPFVWGPIGHHPIIPGQYLQPYARINWVKDRLTWMVKKAFWMFSPGLKKTIQHADHILCMNNSVPEVIDLGGKSYSVFPSVATEDYGCKTEKMTAKFQLISAGRLVPLKGFDLSINAFANFLKADPSRKERSELLIVGSGPEKAYLEQLCIENDILPQVKFIDWIERSALIEMYKDSSAFLFPSHEGAGMVVAEALSFGLPVICLDNAGPGQFINKDCGFAIPQQDYDATISQLSAAISTLYNNPVLVDTMSVAARARFESHFDWNQRGHQFKNIYETL
jgi:glycosyltransferase involved in cell wall biosynthesis